MTGTDGLDPRTLGSQLEQIDASIQPIVRELQQQHPIQAGMLSALFCRALELIRSHDLPPEHFAAKVESLAREIRALSTWLVNANTAASVSAVEAEIDLWVSSYIRAGLKGTAQFAETLRKAWLGRPVGRPPKRKRAAVLALKEKLADPKLTWKDLAVRFWPSEEDANIVSAEQCLRQEVMALRKVLKACRIPEWEPFDRHRTLGR